MNIEVFTFSKRKNSTKVPTSGTLVSCVLKEETSILNPTFLLSSASIPAYNYVKWSDKYYYVDDIASTRNGQWSVQCSMDVLGSYASAIKATSAFIEYADTYDARIYDPRLAKKINATETQGSGSGTYFYNPYGYCVIEIIGSNTSGSFAIARTSVDNLMDNCAQWWTQFEQAHTWASVEEAVKNTCALLITGDAAANIKSCRWIPAAMPSGTSQALYAGLFDTGISGVKIDPNEAEHGTMSITIPHPTSVMLRSSNTCEYTLYLPFVGNVSLSADILADESTLNIDWSISLASGDLGYQIKTSGISKTLGVYGTNIAVDVPIGSSGISARSVVNSIAAAGAIVATGGAAAAAEAGAAATGLGAITALKAAGAGLLNLQGTSSSVGGVGGSSSLELGHSPVLTCSYWEVSDVGSNLTSLIGNPYYKVDTIGNHGFVRCSGASLDAVGYNEVIDRINTFLGAGIYVE